MLQPCQDNYSTTFASYDGMRRYHEKESMESRWHRCRVNELHIEPLDKASPLYGTPSAFAAGISAESVEDTAENLGLAMRVDGSYYPVRSTAYKSLLDRAKISGSALPKLSRQRLASALNDCLELYSSETLLLIRDEKISAAHSGDSMDYSVLPIDELLKVLTKKAGRPFPRQHVSGRISRSFALQCLLDYARAKGRPARRLCQAAGVAGETHTCCQTCSRHPLCYLGYRHCLG